MNRSLPILLGCGWLLVACGGPSENATKNKVFYDWTTASSAAGAEQFEQEWRPLHFQEVPPNPAYRGVTVLRGGVHLSRPVHWKLREAGDEPGHAYIQYISPKGYSFAIYERPDSPADPWRDIISRYEDDVSSVGAKVVGRRVPMATWQGQGRAFRVERSVEASKRPFVSHSREFVVRGGHRVVTVQIVHEGEDLSGIDLELMRVINTLEVL